MAKKETTTKKDNGTVAAKAAKAVAESIFKANSEMKEVHVTSDGTAFYGRNDAMNHANTLKNRDVFSYKRSTLLGGVAEQEPEAPSA